jgi:uncharacterized protein YcbK (DUF882 family)
MQKYIPTHFAVHELVPEHVYRDRGEKAIELLDDRLLITLDQLREKFGPVTVNNWFWGGNRQWSCLRTEKSPHGSMYSQHRFGRAADCLFKNFSASEIRNYILKNPSAFPYITFVELDTEWLHFDVRNCDAITTWSPGK